MLGKLKEIGYGPDKVVPIAFHVDYFNKPWKDRFSDPAYSSRELSYNQALKRNDLYFTPMLMVDGRYPMLGSDQTKAVAALRRTTASAAGATIEAGFKAGGTTRERTLQVEVEPIGAVAVGREVMLGVALFEDPVVTKVESGENKGKTLTERYAVRKFAWKRFRMARGAVDRGSFPLTIPDDAGPAKCGVAVWVQDWNDGRVFQADALPWPTAVTTGTAAAAP